MATRHRFQSTLPVRGATPTARRGGKLGDNFNPRSPYGERLITILKAFNKGIFQSTLPVRGATSALKTTLAVRTISIHAPRTGSDNNRRAIINDRNTISIHAPRTGSDLRNTWKGRGGSYFNPRSPYGERLRYDLQ